MKRRLAKYIALLLSAVLCLGMFAGTASAAVTMPANIEKSRIEAAIPKMESIVGALLKMNDDTADLQGTVHEMLFSDETLNQIFSAVYSEFDEQVPTFSAIGVDISVAGVSAKLGDYPEVQKALSGKATWKDAFAGKFDPAWKVASPKGFGYALSAMFSPLNELLYTLLCGATYRPNLLVSIQGANGYQNAIVPIFRALGTPDILSQEAFSADAKNDRDTMVENIAAMLLSAVDQILASPVTSVCKYLPGIAQFLTSGGLSSALTTLVEPLKVRVGLISLSGLDKLTANLNVLSSSADLTAMLQDMDTSALFGSNVDLTLPKIDLELLASCGTLQGNTFVADQAEAFVVVFRWLMDAVKQNSAKLSEITGQDLSGAKAFLDKFLAKDNDSILKMLLDLLDLKPTDTVLEYNWTYAPFTPGVVNYTPNLTRDNYVRVLEMIDDTLNEFLDEFTENGTLSGILAARIYSNSLVSQLVTGVYGALYTEQTAGALAMLGLDASPAGLADAISDSYPSAARTLRNYSAWDKVNAASLSWGFSNGSKAGFTNALTAVLSPFRPFLSMLLAEGELNLFDTIRVSGSNGYNTAVIPLLEALGCDPASVKSYADYKKTANSNAAVTDILTPITGMLDRLIESPVATMCAILPNIVYFINNGGLGQCVDNLLYPVKVLLKTIDAEDLLSSELTSASQIDLNKTIGDMIANSGLDIKLPAPDLSLLASLGQPENRVSKRTYNGVPANYVYITADSPAVLITVLRYVVGALGSEENAETFSGLLQQDQTEEGDMMAMYTGKVAEQLKTMSTDETIEWLYDLLFAETPKRENPNNGDDYIPTVIYQEKPDHTARNATVIIVIVVILLVGGVVILSRVDIGAWRERRQRKRLKAKTEKAKLKTGAQRPAGTAKPTAAAKPAGTVKSAGTVKPTVTAKPAGTARPAAPESAAKPQNTAVPKTNGMTEKERLKHEKELVKMKIRETKAQQKAYRQTKKADKYYEQALKEQNKKH